MFQTRGQTWSSLQHRCHWRLAWCCCGWGPSSAQGPESAPWRSPAAPPPPTDSCAPIPSVSPPGSPVWHTHTHTRNTQSLYEWNTMCESELFLWKTLIRLSTDENKAVTQSRSRVITLTKNIKWTVICVQKHHRADRQPRQTPFPPAACVSHKTRRRDKCKGENRLQHLCNILWLIKNNRVYGNYWENKGIEEFQLNHVKKGTTYPQRWEFFFTFGIHCMFLGSLIFM